MDIIENIRTRRSIRKFNGKKIDIETLGNLVDVARYAPAAANIQPLKYAVVNSEEICGKIFPHTHWAKLLGSKGTPQKGEEPTAYIIVMKNVKTSMNIEADAAFAIENIVLAAWSMGIGSCILGAIDRQAIAKVINMPAEYEINYAVALGYPKQESIAEEADESVAYYMDESGVVHVPKRKLSDVMYVIE